MIDFDNIENSLHCEIADDNGDGSCDLTNAALLELVIRLRQAEKDAARYRWLRDYHIGDYPENINLDGRGSLDDAIDEAMQCK